MTAMLAFEIYFYVSTKICKRFSFNNSNYYTLSYGGLTLIVLRFDGVNRPIRFLLVQSQQWKHQNNV